MASARPETRDWDAFFAGIPADAPVPVVVALLESIRPGIARILVSARPEDHRYATELWLMEHGINYDALLLRASGDTRPDTAVKHEILRTVERRFEPLVVIDDRESVIQMWQLNGLPVVRVTDPGLAPVPVGTWNADPVDPPRQPRGTG